MIQIVFSTGRIESYYSHPLDPLSTTLSPSTVWHGFRIVYSYSVFCIESTALTQYGLARVSYRVLVFRILY